MLNMPPGSPFGLYRGAVVFSNRGHVYYTVFQIYRYATGILIVLILFRGGMVWWYYKWYLIL